MAHFWSLLILVMASPVLGVSREVLFNVPTPTSASNAHGDSIAPAPTAKTELLKRDEYPIGFCGWQDGLSSYAPCNAFSTCLWRSDISAVGCCRDTTNLNTCGMFTTCINYSELGAAPIAQSDSLLLRW